MEPGGWDERREGKPEGQTRINHLQQHKHTTERQRTRRSGRLALKGLKNHLFGLGSCPNRHLELVSFGRNVAKTTILHFYEKEIQNIL